MFHQFPIHVPSDFSSALHPFPIRDTSIFHQSAIHVSINCPRYFHDSSTHVQQLFPSLLHPVSTHTCTAFSINFPANCPYIFPFLLGPFSSKLSMNFRSIHPHQFRTHVPVMLHLFPLSLSISFHQTIFHELSIHSPHMLDQFSHHFSIHISLRFPTRPLTVVYIGKAFACQSTDQAVEWHQAPFLSRCEAAGGRRPRSSKSSGSKCSASTARRDLARSRGGRATGLERVGSTEWRATDACHARGRSYPRQGLRRHGAAQCAVLRLHHLAGPSGGGVRASCPSAARTSRPSTGLCSGGRASVPALCRSAPWPDKWNFDPKFWGLLPMKWRSVWHSELWRLLKSKRAELRQTPDHEWAAAQNLYKRLQIGVCVWLIQKADFPEGLVHHIKLVVVDLPFAPPTWSTQPCAFPSPQCGFQRKQTLFHLCPCRP